MAESKAVNLDVFGVGVCVEFGEEVPADLSEKVRSIWSDVPRAPGRCDVVVSVPCCEPDRYLERLSSEVTLAAIAHRAGQLMMLHAAGISDQEGRVLAFVGPSGRGKTTLSRALARHFGYVTDETVAVDEALRVLPYRKPLSVKRPDMPKEQLSPSADRMLALPPVPLRLAGLVVLDRREGVAQPYFEPISLREALEALVPETSYLARMERPLQRLAGIYEQTGSAVRAVYSEAETLLDLVPELYEREVHQVSWAPLSPDVQTLPASSAAGPQYSMGKVLDAIEADDSVLLFSQQGILHVLVGVGPILWKMAARGASLSSLVAEVVDRFGEPPRGDARSIVEAALEEMVDLGLLSRH